MDKPKRSTLYARIAPSDLEKITTRAEKERRTVGETISLILRERELYEVALAQAGATNGN